MGHHFLIGLRIKIMRVKTLLRLLVCLTSVTGSMSAQESGNRVSRIEKEALAANEQGVLLVKSAMYEEAVAAFGLAIKLYPRFAIAYNNLGATYNSLDRHEDAIKVLKRAIELAPDYA